MPDAQRNRLTPEAESGGAATNHSFSFVGLIAVKPLSAALTFIQAPPLWEKAVAGAPLSCVPPKIRLASVADCDNDTNCVSGPSVWFRLSNWLLRPQVPVVSPAYPSNARYIPPSLAQQRTADPFP